MSERVIAIELLQIEHWNFARKIGLINGDEKEISYELLIKSLSAIDNLSKDKNDFAKRLIVLLVSILWEYSNEEFKESLREIFIVILSRAGVAPSTILIDDNYKLTNKYSSTKSYFSELSTLIHQLENEIKLGDKTYLLTEFQKLLWDKIEKEKILGISAPTSAGKSFIIYLKIIDFILKGANFVLYIVPTLSLVSQVTNDLTNLKKEYSLYDIELFNSYQDKRYENVIYVLTQERAISAFNHENPFLGLDILVVDEIQNIEKVADESEQRSKILYDVLKEIKHLVKPSKIILSGPRLKNIGNLGFDIFGDTSEEEENKVQPVASLTYSVSYSDENFVLKQFSDILEEPREILIENHEIISGLGKSLYNDAYHEYLSSLINKLGLTSNNIIFAPNPSHARKTADYLSKHSGTVEDIGDNLLMLSDYIKESVHPHYDLSGMILNGVAYHTGRTPSHIRRVIEEAYSAGLINNIVCTTTLMQGVNLPAQNIFIRNPRLFVRKTSPEAPELSNYEFANLRGRAGRLLKDFIGRTIVLDESSFTPENEEEDKLFGDTHKELTAGYKEIFEKYEDEILTNIENNNDTSSGPEKYVLTYIRQTLLRLKEKGFERLKEVGIDISSEYIDKVFSSLSELQIPDYLCIQNRYWDPLDLNKIYQDYTNGDIPPLASNIWDSDLVVNLTKLLIYHNENFEYYYYRYLGKQRGDIGKYAWSLSKSAESWGRENLLSEIIEKRGFTDNINNEIDNLISILNGKVVYGLPMLLKPVASISHQDNPILSVIEQGAYNTTTRFLIDKGVPRDTSIHLQRTILSDIKGDEEKLPQLVSEYISRSEKHLSYWIKKQLNTVI